MHETETGKPTPFGYKMGGVLVLAVAALVVVYGVWSRRQDEQNLHQRAQASAVPTVMVITPRTLTDQTTTLVLPAKLEAIAKAPIYARVGGYLKSWHVEIGTYVKAGQLLAVIETPELDQQLLQAQAELLSVKANAAMAATTAKRWQSLLDKNFVSEQAVEEKNGDAAIKAALVNASVANVERLRLMKEFSRITAPFAGVVTTRSTDVGALISVGSAPGTELFTVADISQMRILVNVPQSLVSSLKPGTQARVTVPEQPGKFYTAQVQSMAQAITAGSGTMLIQMIASNPHRELIAGAYAQVTFELPNQTGHWMIPPSAVMMGKEGPRVALVDADHKVVIRKIGIARDHGAEIEVADGLSAEDRIIQSPPEGLAPGDVVKLAPTPPKTPR